MSKVCH